LDEDDAPDEWRDYSDEDLDDGVEPDEWRAYTDEDE